MYTQHSTLNTTHYTHIEHTTASTSEPYIALSVDCNAVLGLSFNNQNKSEEIVGKYKCRATVHFSALLASETCAVLAPI